MICIYLPFKGIAGTEYRMLKVIIRFPNKYTILIPSDYRELLIKSMIFIKGDPDIEKMRKAINEGFILRDFENHINALRFNTLIHSISERYLSFKYGEYIAKLARSYGCELIYMAYTGNQTYVIPGLKSFPKVAVMLQNTPVIESLIVDEGSPLKILASNIKLL